MLNIFIRKISENRYLEKIIKKIIIKNGNFRANVLFKNVYNPKKCSLLKIISEEYFG